MRVYVALGGNIGNTREVFIQALEHIACMPTTHSLLISRLYRNPAISEVAQPDYLNAAVSFETDLSVKELWNGLESIEKKLGKVPKEKDHPRVIDLDLLFYGDFHYKEEDLEIPHPRWKERLFVLIPLLDLTERSHLSAAKTERILQLIATFSKKEQQLIHCLGDLDGKRTR